MKKTRNGDGGNAAYMPRFTAIYKAAIDLALMRISISEGRDVRDAIGPDGRVRDTNAVWLACAKFGDDVDALETALLTRIMRRIERIEMGADAPPF